jgi:hypothetical protein
MALLQLLSNLRKRASLVLISSAFEVYIKEISQHRFTAQFAARLLRKYTGREVKRTVRDDLQDATGGHA